MRKGIIYLAHNTVNNKIYIGQTIQKLSARKHGHLFKVKKGFNSYFCNALRKYGIDVFEWDILEEVTIDELDNAEIFWIQYFKYIGAELYNLTDGGNVGTRGYRFSDEAKQRMSEERKGRTHSTETRMKMSDAHQGHKFSDTSEEKMSISKSGGKSFTFIDSSGNIYKNVTNIRAFCREHGLTKTCMGRIVLGQRKSHKGFRLYVEIG